jgi:hypothetical protein
MKIYYAFRKKPSVSSSTSGRLASKIIQFWTGHDYFHVELIINGLWISAMPGKGVYVKEVFENYNIRDWDYYELDAPDLTLEQQIILDKFLEDISGSKYDWAGIILSQFIPLGLNSEKKWFCSELANNISQLLYIEPLLGTAPRKYSPAKLYKSLETRLTKVKLPNKKASRWQ